LSTKRSVGKDWSSVTGLEAMTSKRLISSDLQQVEQDIDAEFKRNPLLALPFSQAAWWYLIFCEDKLLKGLEIDDLGSRQGLMCFVDDLVTGMKTPLLWLWQSCEAGRTVSTGFSDYYYKAAWDLSLLGDAYSPFENAYKYASAGLIPLKLDGHTVTPQVLFSDGSEYEAYDRLFSDAEPNGREFSDEAKEWFNDIRQTVTIAGTKFSYQLNPAIVAQGVDVLSPILDRQFRLPSTWKLPRYTFGDFHAVISIIRVMAMAHYLAHIAAARNRCEGLGVVSSVRLMKKQELVKRIRRYSNLDTTVIESIVRDITFGERGIRNPDPALQPLIPLTKDRIAISPALFLGLDVERNFTVLLNRIDGEKEAYSRLSTDRENITRTRMTDILSSQTLSFWHGALPGKPDLPDVDLAIIDHEERVCLVLELKSFIQPAEPREILEKNQEIQKGVAQCLSLKETYSQSSGVFMSCLEIDDRYEVVFAVASETFVGTNAVQNDEIPVVRSFHLVRHLVGSKSLRDTCSWLQKREYLPVRGREFDVQDTVSTVGKWNVKWYGIKPLISDAYS
jgi:hypothetical protein